ncbi:MAG: hypothetical protein KF745_08490 [Phycisphaeraceae bacterium]|nr:hypothetical protein [Phycisphaeraceae bacterium]
MPDAPPSPPPTPAAAESCRFVQSGHRSTMAAGAIMLLILAAFPVLITLLALGLGRFLQGVLGLAGVTGPLVAVVGTVGFVVLVIAFVRWYRVSSKYERLPGLLDRTIRIQVVAWARQVPELQAIGDTPFEPRIARLPLGVFRIAAVGPQTTPPTRAEMAAGARRGVGLAVGINATVWLLTFGIRHSSPTMQLAIPAIVFFAFVLLWFWPVYIRVTPGRLEVIRFNPLRGSSPPAVERFDLRTQRLVVDIKTWLITIEPPEEGKAGATAGPGTMNNQPPALRRDISLLFVPSRRELAEAVIMGALSTTPTPELAADDLSH